ncbi:MAG TPA: endonuclease/exonuclease/phosphatase family protein [Salinimicrobium sp.]|nr:endonuclease/exonuclease/phosphatase family protein [Salinimicrobium sp.]
MNSAPEIIAAVLVLFTMVPAIASISKFDHWMIRGFDFPRLQISFITLLVFLLVLISFSFDNTFHYILSGLVLACLVYQVVKIFPYTIFAKKQVMSFKGEDPDKLISILVSNVLMTNRDYNRLISHIHNYQPDLLLTLETDKKWEEALSVIEEKFPYSIKIPQDNLYGMHLYSKLELQDIEIKNLISDEIPSIHGFVKMKCGQRVKIHCLHPKPPSPTEDDTSTNRDAELLMVGKDAKADEESIIVFGDLNDVAWSRTTRLFQKISGLLDPRRGRGFFNTFNANYPLFRWPLDHLFHTCDFTVVEIHRLKNIGSDHFPIFVKLNFEPRAEIIQEETPEADQDEKEWVDEKISDGKPQEMV